MCLSEADSGSSLSAINATAVGQIVKAGKNFIEHGNQLLDPKSGFSKEKIVIRNSRPNWFSIG